jgi:cellulose synthase/poly-beta-1,6-N-acetylglucosamine synthase-like glycosyltransferase
VDMVICHGTRCGRSAAINAAARFASGDLLLTVDADTVFEPTAVARLAAAFSDPHVAARRAEQRHDGIVIFYALSLLSHLLLRRWHESAIVREV